LRAASQRGKQTESLKEGKKKETERGDRIVIVQQRKKRGFGRILERKRKKKVGKGTGRGSAKALADQKKKKGGKPDQLRTK